MNTQVQIDTMSDGSGIKITVANGIFMTSFIIPTENTSDITNLILQKSKEARAIQSALNDKAPITAGKRGKK